MNLTSWLERLQTLVLVIVLSLLLWSWSDRELRAPAEMELTIRVAADRGVSPETIHVNIQVEGPQKAVADLRAAAEAGNLPLTYQVPRAESDRDSHTVRVLEWLRRQDRFRGDGIDVVFANPITRDVEFERDYDLPVVVRDRQGFEISDALTTVRPSAVKVRMLRRVHDALRDRRVTAEVDRTALAAIAGRPEELIAALKPIEGASLQTAAVRVSAALKTATKEIPSLPVHVSVEEPRYWRDYMLDVDPKVLRVKVIVRGPKERIDRLVADDIFAYVVVGSSNTVAVPLDSPIRFTLPEGIELVRSEGPDLRSPEPAGIKIPLKMRAAASGGN